MKEKEKLATESLTGPCGNETGRALILAADEMASLSLPTLVQQSGLEPVSMRTMAHLRSSHLSSTISLLLCEERLPDGTFRDALDFLHGIAQRTPVIVFSRTTEWENYLAAMRYGAYDCLRYPFRTGELQWIIGRLLQKHCLLSLDSSRELRS